MKIAHIELSNKHKTLGKLQNIRDLEGGWAVLPFKQHPVYYMLQYFIIDYGEALPLRGLPRYYSVG